jgi:hypothetical protein
MSEKTICPACKAETAVFDGPVHRYLASSPGCWNAFCEVLNKEYSDFEYGKNHRLTVDAYALQHPGNPSPQTISSVAIHLASLCQILEHGYSLSAATEFMQAFADHKDAFLWLDPPADLGAINVADVLASDTGLMHLTKVEEWATTTWQAWHAHHQQINSWIQQYA